ncbi:MAG: nicotinate-nucleotide adenylyltransferase [Muribaculaceae bacterium]|nr:nicotinate-nucleotide adenylyltransferase [Muribaculaceae bacterium]
MRKIGIFGGSFNPIHVGHAIIASYVMEHAGLDQLWLMVSPQNPLKQDLAMAPEVDRLRMTELVTRRLDGVETSAFEMSLPRPSYTIDTLRALQEKFPDGEFYLLIGADNWALFERWRAHDEILRDFHLIVYPRRGFDIKVPEELAERVTMVDAPLIEVSSTGIREALAQGRDVSFYVPDDVLRYIKKNNLYTPA